MLNEQPPSLSYVTHLSYVTTLSQSISPYLVYSTAHSLCLSRSHILRESGDRFHIDRYRLCQGHDVLEKAGHMLDGYVREIHLRRGFMYIVHYSVYTV